MGKIKDFFKKHFTPRKIIAWTSALSILGIIFAVESCKTYAYSVDTNGNLVSDNLFDITDFFSKYDTRYSLYTDNYYRVSLKQIMFTNHYDLKIDNHNNISFSGYIKDLDTRNVRIRVYDNEGTTIYNTIGQTDSNGYFQTAPLDNVYSIGFDWSAMGDCLIKDLMFNYGTAKSYEPYGQKYYSFQNYDNAYDTGYNTATDLFSNSIFTPLYINNLYIDNCAFDGDPYFVERIDIIIDGVTYVGEVDKTFSKDGFLGINNGYLSMWDFLDSEWYPPYMADVFTYDLVFEYSTPVKLSGIVRSYGALKTIYYLDGNVAYASSNVEDIKDINVTFDKVVFTYPNNDITKNYGIQSNMSTTIYNSGYNTGFQNGYDSGKNAGSIDSYNKGYIAGSEHGQNIGYTNGYNEGSVAGAGIGYDNGYRDGLSVQSNAYDTGYSRSDLWQDVPKFLQLLL